MTTKEKAKGKWYGILVKLGIPPKVLDKKNQPCLWCGGKDRFRWTDHNDNGGYYCQCAHGSGFDMLMRFHGWDYPTAAKEVEALLDGYIPENRGKTLEEKQNAITDLWNSGKNIAQNSPVERYLMSRGINLPKYPQTMLSVDLMKNEGHNYHGMICRVDDEDGKLVNVHRTFICSEGKKHMRKTMQGKIPNGCAIRLYNAKPIMGIAEGVETALAAMMHFKMPVWSVISAGNMQTFYPPPEVKGLWIFGDCDHSFTGQAAAYEAARKINERAKREGRDIEINVLIPGEYGTDWADI